MEDRRRFITTASLAAAAAMTSARGANGKGTARRSGTPDRSRVWRIGTPPSIANLQLVTRDTPTPAADAGAPADAGVVPP